MWVWGCGFVYMQALGTYVCTHRGHNCLPLKFVILFSETLSLTEPEPH